MVNWAAAEGIESYGVLGFSQGGMVALNIMNAFFTGVDAAVGNRKVQSLASPFYGNSASSNADFLKNVFGMGCGSADDLGVVGCGGFLGWEKK